MSTTYVITTCRQHQGVGTLREAAEIAERDRYASSGHTISIHAIEPGQLLRDLNEAEEREVEDYGWSAA